MLPYHLLSLILTIHIHHSLQSCRKSTRRPNIIVIIADDMGRNDISLHGSNQIPTPNIDALAYNGIVLDKYYVQNSCTPTRAAFLTGNYPIRSGMQGYPIVAGQNRSLPLDMPIMPQHLKKLGYKTHIVGKWHLGSAYRSSTPTRRGFDSHFGYWNGFLGYFDYLTDFNDTKVEGFDLHNRFKPSWNYSGSYATSVFTNKAVEVIDGHNTKKPLFLMVAHLAVHAGRDGTELGVPNKTATDLKFNFIKNARRRLYAEVVTQLDNSVGTIIQKLSERKMLDNSIILFFSDNGAPTIGAYANTGSNWPLRGIKMTNFEGGVRGTGIIFSPYFRKQGYVNTELIHVTDWLPTFYSAAGGDVDDLGTIDGVNQWSTLSNNNASPRTEILVALDEVHNTTAFISSGGRFKLVTGTHYNATYENYFGDSGRESPEYDADNVLDSVTNQLLEEVTFISVDANQIAVTRRELDLSWCRPSNFSKSVNCSNACLFDLMFDPCETSDIADENPELVAELLARIRSYRPFLVPQGNETVDWRANPLRYNNTWCTWLDDAWCVKTPRSVLRL